MLVGFLCDSFGRNGFSTAALEKWSKVTKVDGFSTPAASVPKRAL